MPDIHITINGDNNQVLPNATEAIQNIYVGGSVNGILAPGNAKQVLAPEAGESLSSEAQKLLPYVKDELLLRNYLQRIGECVTARDVAQVILTLQEQERKVPAGEELKERFINLFLPFVPKGAKGMTAHNIYTHIVNLKAARPWGTGK